MKKIISAMLVSIFLCGACFIANSEAMVAVSQSVDRVSYHDRKQESLGYYGGVKKNTRFLLILSEGVRRYFGINSDTRVIMNGIPISISRLPINAPVRVIARKGIILEVQVMEDIK
jgi:hypothetical protein